MSSKCGKVVPCMRLNLYFIEFLYNVPALHNLLLLLPKASELKEVCVRLRFSLTEDNCKSLTVYLPCLFIVCISLVPVFPLYNIAHDLFSSSDFIWLTRSLRAVGFHEGRIFLVSLVNSWPSKYWLHSNLIIIWFSIIIDSGCSAILLQTCSV